MINTPKVVLYHDTFNYILKTFAVSAKNIIRASRWKLLLHCAPTPAGRRKLSLNPKALVCPADGLPVTSMAPPPSATRVNECVSTHT